MKRGAKDSAAAARVGHSGDFATLLRSGPGPLAPLGSRTHLTPHMPALDRPPFAVVGALDSAQVAAEMVACFHALGKRPDRMAHAHALALRSIGRLDGAAAALAAAGAAIARDIDHGVGAGVASGYHNPQHFLEVMLCALYLAQVHRFDALRAVRLVTAGLIHDFHHDGSRGASAPYRLELLALQQARPYLSAASVDALEASRLDALVLATEPRAGVPYARGCWQRHRGAAPSLPSMPAASALPEALQRLAAEPELARDAVLLAEADVLPSIGLTLEHADALQARLAVEWRTPLGRDDKIQFIDRMIGEISVAQFFVPNVLRLREAYAGGSA